MVIEFDFFFLVTQDTSQQFLNQNGVFSPDRNNFKSEIC